MKVRIFTPMKRPKLPPKDASKATISILAIKNKC